MTTYKPGEIAPDSGELIEVGPRGGKVESGRQTEIERGERIASPLNTFNIIETTLGTQVRTTAENRAFLVVSGLADCISNEA